MTDNDQDGTSREGRSEERLANRTDGTFSTDQLFGGRDEILIRHGDDTYRLRITRTGKLILHK
jgi:hemin uptake protein HemP